MSDPQLHNADGGLEGYEASLSGRLKGIWALEFANLRWWFMVCTLGARLLPQGRMPRLRTSLLRAIGLDIGSGTRFMGMPKLQCPATGPLRPKLHIGANCTIGAGVILEFGEAVNIGDRVTLAEGAVILTTTHQLGPRDHRAGPVVKTPVAIGNDVAIGANAIVLPGATIGDAARVLPNSVVNASVAAGATVSGIPARPLRPA